MSKALLVRGARQLLTLHGASGPRRGAAMSELGLIEDGALLAIDGTIVAVGPTRRVENLAEARGARVLSADGRVVMPGLIDCHTHLDSQPPDFSQIDGAQPPTPSSARILLDAQKVVRTAVRHGTTTIEAKAAVASAEIGELRALRAYSKLNEHPIEVIPTFCPEPEMCSKPGYLQWVCSDLLPKIQSRKLARFADFECAGEPGADLDRARIYFSRASSLGFPGKLQCDRHSASGLARLGVEYDLASVDQLNQIADTDLPYLERSAAVAVLLPGFAYHSGDPFPPARRLIDAGVPVALASGFEHSRSPVVNMQMVIALACRYLRMTPAEAITACTINAAHALRAGESIGSLEAGKKADLLLLNASDYRAIPHYFGVNLAAMSIKAGETVWKQSEVRT